MLPYIIDWLSLLGRWVHLITGIAWIGSSFYFVWLDNHLQPPKSEEDAGKGVGGEIWSVHGGGLYHAQKYRTPPAVMPATLHWFKWEAYTTWLTGMFMLCLIYWYGAEIYLVNSAVSDLTPLQAVGAAISFIVGGWIVYDLMCKSPLGRNETALAGGLFVLVVFLAWALCQLFSGRGAYIHFGAVLGTIMVANVFFVIIPGQKQMVAAAERGETPDPIHGIRGKQRSVHNTYFTLPVLFVMVSNHYAMTYSHEYNWLVLVGLSLAGALIRVFFVARHTAAARGGRTSPTALIIAGLILAVIAAAIAPQTTKPVSKIETETTISSADLQVIMTARCTTCHAQTPTYAAYTTPPAGVMLETIAQIEQNAARIHEQTVVTKVMPIGNLTKMTDAERADITQWYQALQP